MFKVINASIAIGSDSQPEALKDIAQKGYKTVVDLCTAAEGNQLDASEVKGLALEYVSVPISPKTLSRDTLETFKQAIHTSPQPTYVRCASGLRAGVFSLLALAEQEGWSETQYLGQFQSLRIDQKPDCPIGSFAHNYFEQKV